MNIIWSKLKKRIKSFVASELQKRIEFHLTGYHNAHDGVGEAFITLDKEKIIEGSHYKFTINRYSLEDEDEDEDDTDNVHIVNKNSLDFINNGFCDTSYITSIIEKYLNLPFENFLETNNPLFKILLLMDRRLGKRTFLKIKMGENEYEGVKKMYFLRKELFGLNKKFKIKYNKVFNDFLENFDIGEDLKIDIDIPKEVLKIISQKVFFNDKTIHFKDYGEVTYGIYGDECFEEKSHNHFHVDWYIKPMDTEKCFKLGVKTLILLASKLREKGIYGVGLYYSFHSAELSKMFDKSLGNNIFDDDNYTIGDELSFYKIRKKSTILDDFETKYWALLNIEI